MPKFVYLPQNIGDDVAVNPDQVRFVAPYSVGNDELTVIRFDGDNQLIVKLSVEDTINRLIRP